MTVILEQDGAQTEWLAKGEAAIKMVKEMLEYLSTKLGDEQFG